VCKQSKGVKPSLRLQERLLLLLEPPPVSRQLHREDLEESLDRVQGQEVDPDRVYDQKVDQNLSQDREVKVTAEATVIREVEATVEATVIQEAEAIVEATATQEAEAILPVLEVIRGPTLQGQEAIQDLIPVDLDLTLEVILVTNPPIPTKLQGKKGCSLMPKFPLPSHKICDCSPLQLPKLILIRIQIANTKTVGIRNDVFSAVFVFASFLSVLLVDHCWRHIGT